MSNQCLQPGHEEGPGHLATALGWLRKFIATFPSRQLFVAHEEAGDVHAAVYNEKTFRPFGEFVRKHGHCATRESR